MNATVARRVLELSRNNSNDLVISIDSYNEDGYGINTRVLSYFDKETWAESVVLTNFYTMAELMGDNVELEAFGETVTLPESN